MLGNKLIDGIIKEPLGGAHHNPNEIYSSVKKEIKKVMKDLKALSVEELVAERINKFSSMGAYQEL